MKEAIGKLVEREDLRREEMSAVFEEIFAGAASPAQLGALLVALRMKGETPEEIAGAATVMRRLATPVRIPDGRTALDTCGTGGDGAGTFNISTAVALVAAAAGATVAKHGNRSISSKSGSADVLKACGVNIGADVATVERCIAEIGIGFLFAPGLHGVMKQVAGPRSEVGVRSIFNLLGPLSNPAGAQRQLLGVYHRRLVPVVARTLLALGTEKALVVHGEPGLDELSPCGSTSAALVEHGEVKLLNLRPEDAGVTPVSIESLAGGGPEENARLLERILAGEPGPCREAVVLNGAAAVWVAGLVENLKDGAALCRQVLDDGRAQQKLQALVKWSNAAEAAKQERVA